MLTDSLWNRLSVVLKLHGRYNTKDSRKIIEAILWKMRTGAPWRDIPKELCPWQTALTKFNRWSKEGLWQKLFICFRSDQYDKEWHFIDGTYIKAHQHSSGAPNGQLASIGMSAGGKTSKIHMIADGHGNPIRFVITEGNVHDSQPACELIYPCSAEFLVADKAYDSQEIRDQIVLDGSTPIIPLRSNSTKENPDFDKYIYQLRHLIENLFARLKHFRSIATRYNKLARNYASMLALACTFIWIKL